MAWLQHPDEGGVHFEGGERESCGRETFTEMVGVKLAPGAPLASTASELFLPRQPPYWSVLCKVSAEAPTPGPADLALFRAGKEHFEARST